MGLILDPRQGKSRVEASTPDHNLVIKQGAELNPAYSGITVAGYGELDSQVKLDFGTFGGMNILTRCIDATLSGSDYTVTDFFPGNVVVLGMKAKVLTAITGASSWDFGYEGDTDAWGDNEALTLGTELNMSDWTVTTVPFHLPGVVDLIFTANTSDFTGGRVKAVFTMLSWDDPTA